MISENYNNCQKDQPTRVAQATQANYGLHSHDAHANMPLT